MTEESVIIQVAEEQRIALARQTAKATAEAIGLSRPAVYCVATSVSELACNLYFHAHSGGTISFSAVRQNGVPGIEVVGEDYGPGIPDVKLAMHDNFSAGGSGMGGGLPGVKRMMDEFEITSSPGVGTRIVARRWRTCE